MEHELTRRLLILANAFASATGMAEATFSERAAGDWQFFAKLRRGQINFRIRTFDRAIRWFDSNWPVDATWPPEIDRPCLSSGYGGPSSLPPTPAAGSPPGTAVGSSSPP